MGIIRKTLFSNGLIPNFNLIAAIAVILTFLHRACYVCGSSGGVMGGSDWDSYSDSSYDSYDSSYSSSSSYSSYDDDDNHHHQLYSSPRQESSAVGLCVFVTVFGAVMVIAYVNDTHDRKISVVKVQVSIQLAKWSMALINHTQESLCMTTTGEILDFVILSLCT